MSVVDDMVQKRRSETESKQCRGVRAMARDAKLAAAEERSMQLLDTSQ